MDLTCGIDGLEVRVVLQGDTSSAGRWRTAVRHNGVEQVCDCTCRERRVSDRRTTV